MVHRQFVNRESELDLLESRFERDTADFVVVYGRRRLGKSELVREAIRDREDAVYWQATEETPSVQLKHFIDTATDTYPNLATSSAIGNHSSIHSARKTRSWSSTNFRTSSNPTMRSRRNSSASGTCISKKPA